MHRDALNRVKGGRYNGRRWDSFSPSLVILFFRRLFVNLSGAPVNDLAGVEGRSKRLPECIRS